MNYCNPIHVLRLHIDTKNLPKLLEEKRSNILMCEEHLNCWTDLTSFGMTGKERTICWDIGYTLDSWENKAKNKPNETVSAHRNMVELEIM